jgi:3'-phosphoadenosine 5'-phosphosulfate (PAPS) 3'-phosphatase
MTKTIETETKYEIIKSEDSIISENDIPEKIRELDTSELCIYIDPIDSTSEFINRNFAPVTSLIGITLNQEAFMGMVHFPFYKGDKNNSLVFFNIPTRGNFIYNTETNDIKSITTVFSDKWDFMTSASRRNKDIEESI